VQPHVLMEAATPPAGLTVYHKTPDRAIVGSPWGELLVRAGPVWHATTIAAWPTAAAVAGVPQLLVVTGRDRDGNVAACDLYPAEAARFSVQLAGADEVWAECFEGDTALYAIHYTPRLMGAAVPMEVHHGSEAPQHNIFDRSTTCARLLFLTVISLLHRQPACDCCRGSGYQCHHNDGSVSVRTCYCVDGCRGAHHCPRHVGQCLHVIFIFFPHVGFIRSSPANCGHSRQPISP